MANKKKQTKAQRLAKARAYSKKLTHGKAMDAYAAGTAIIDRTIKASQSDFKDLHHIKAIMSDYAAFDPNSGEVHVGNLVRGYGPSISNQIERGAYKALGITRPPTDPKTIQAFLKWGAYHGAAAWHAYENKDDLMRANQEFTKTHFGIDLAESGLNAINVDNMIFEKEVPYILVSKVQQIPFIKKQFAKLNKIMNSS